MANRVPVQVEPDCLYDYTELARILNQTPRQFKENYILNGRVPYTPAGTTYWILGHAIIKAVASLQTRWGEEGSKGWGDDDKKNDSKGGSGKEG